MTDTELHVINDTLRIGVGFCSERGDESYSLPERIPPSTTTTRHAMPKCRKGLVLVFTLAMIAMAAVLMSTVATRSLRLATSALSQQRDLQTRWARATLQSIGNAIATNPALIGTDFDTGLNSTQSGPVRLRWRIHLSGIPWIIEHHDESAKISLPALAARYPPAIVSKVSSSLDGASGNSFIVGRGRRWNRWIDPRTSGSPAPQLLPQQTRNVTLYGSGRLNLRTATPQTTEALWQQIFGTMPPPDLWRTIQQTPALDINTLSGGLELSDSENRLLRQWFQVQSDCHSTWILSTQSGGPVWQHIVHTTPPRSQTSTYQY